MNRWCGLRRWNRLGRWNIEPLARPDAGRAQPVCAHQDRGGGTATCGNRVQRFAITDDVDRGTLERGNRSAASQFMGGRALGAQRIDGARFFSARRRGSHRMACVGKHKLNQADDDQDGVAISGVHICLPVGQLTILATHTASPRAVFERTETTFRAEIISRACYELNRYFACLQWPDDGLETTQLYHKRKTAQIH